MTTNQHNPATAPDSAFIEAKPLALGADLDDIEVSFVMPCLNEGETIERCVQAARKCIEAHELRGEIVIGDNGSTDGSQDKARRAGARVVDVPMRGVGAATMAAIDAARGKYIVLGDSDLQHDFSACYPFVEKLREGKWDLVMGSRFKGRIMPGAMRTLNRYVGNPILSFIGRTLFGAPVSDFHCGLRAFPKARFGELNLRTIGFEFTTDHIAKTALSRQRITEIPITVYPEGRSRPPHLRPFRDGWRTLRFMLLLSPRWTLVYPGAALALVGAVLAALVATGPLEIRPGLNLDLHTLVLGCLMVLVGYSAVTIGFAARFFAVAEEIGPPGKLIQKAVSRFTLEFGLVVGALLLAGGLSMIGWLSYRAITEQLAAGEIQKTMRPMVIGATLTALGVQTVLMSFFYSMLGVRSSSRMLPRKN